MFVKPAMWVLLWQDEALPPEMIFKYEFSTMVLKYSLTLSDIDVEQFRSLELNSRSTRALSRPSEACINRNKMAYEILEKVRSNKFWIPKLQITHLFLEKIILDE